MTRIVSIIAVLLVPLTVRLAYNRVIADVTDPDKQVPIVWATPPGYLPMGTMTPLTFPTVVLPGMGSGGIPSR